MQPNTVPIKRCRAFLNDAPIFTSDKTKIEKQIHVDLAILKNEEIRKAMLSMIVRRIACLIK